MHVRILQTEELGDRSYLVHDGASAVVIDPQRDIERIESIAEREGVAVTLVLETHMHNDYVSGGLALARRTGARYGISAAERADFGHVAVRDADQLDAGSLVITATATPGHTDGHIAYLIEDSATPDDPPAAFTGGSLLFGTVGRTDLADAERAEDLAREQHRSVRRLAALLPDDAPIFPTHGFGGFCSSGPAGAGLDSTIGAERRANDAFLDGDASHFARRLVGGLGEYPSYYAHMAAINRAGLGTPPALALETIELPEVRARIDCGEWVIDVGERAAYAECHLGGSVGIALGPQFSANLGWLVPWGSPITLIGRSREQIDEAARQLSRIGVDRPGASVIESLDAASAAAAARTYPRATFGQLPNPLPPSDAILDVRRDDERRAGHIQGSLHVPLHRLPAALADLPRRRLWVHCASGYRASIAASLLDRAGLETVYLDDDFGNAGRAGLAIRPGTGDGN